MRVAVFGTGAVGAYFGGRLAEAGEDVTFIARGENLLALRAHGLRVASIAGDFHLPTVRATDDPALAGPVDVVLVGVKAGQVAGIAPLLRPLLGPHTVVLPLQNGVEAAEHLAAALGPQRVLLGLCRIIVQQVGPGAFRHSGVAPALAFGALDARLPMALGPLRHAFRRAGIGVEEPADLRVALWEKFLFVAPFGTVGAAARVPMGELLAVPESRALLRACVIELAALARAGGVALPADAVDGVWKRYEQTPVAGTTSMQRDLLAGRPSELQAQTGAVVRLGQTHRVPTPVHDILYAVLWPQEIAATRLNAAPH
ncbi:2-dehydropantoate 2-reductase [Hymenobacter sp. UYCo722]|uniref:2-dehydropantoate 2-reductase n=1 Tax=Hymenobacter sp. UYCo722 TaxID=3156335 RepID=UPI003394EAD3